MLRLLRRADGDELEEFCSYVQLERGRSPRTTRAYRQQAISVSEMLGKPWQSVTPKDIRFVIKRNGASLHTINLRVTTFRQIHKWALLEGKPWADPAMLAVDSLRVPKRKKPPISLQDAHKLLANCQTPNEHRVVYFGLLAGMRVSESASIRQAHIGRDRIIFVGKGDKEREVPIHPALRGALPTILCSKPKTGAVLIQVFSKLRDRLDIRDLKNIPATSHSLRRTCADFMYSHAGVPREVVKAVLGHGEEVTDLYAGVRFPALKQAIEAIDYSIGEPVQLRLFA